MDDDPEYLEMMKEITENEDMFFKFLNESGSFDEAFEKDFEDLNLPPFNEEKLDSMTEEKTDAILEKLKKILQKGK